MSDISLFIDSTPEKKGFVTYEDNNKCSIFGKGSVGILYSTTISNVILVEGIKHNLPRISQLYDKGYKINFTNTCFIIEHNDKKDYSLKSLRVNNIYMLNLDGVSLTSTKYLVTMSEDYWLWHTCITHVNFDLLNKVVLKDLVISLPKIKVLKYHLCDACQMGKQTMVSLKSKIIISTSRPLEFIHMDLFGPSRTKILGGNYYSFVILDEYSTFYWTIFCVVKMRLSQLSHLLEN